MASVIQPDFYFSFHKLRSIPAKNAGIVMKYSSSLNWQIFLSTHFGAAPLKIMERLTNSV